MPFGQNVFKKKESTLDYEKLQKEIKKKKKIIHNPYETNNLSIDVLYANMKLALYSFKKNILGHGLHNYEKVHQKYIIITNDSNVKGTMWLTERMDPMFLIKVLLNLEYFFFFFLIILFFFVFNKK